MLYLVGLLICDLSIPRNATGGALKCPITIKDLTEIYIELETQKNQTHETGIWNCKSLSRYEKPFTTYQKEWKHRLANMFVGVWNERVEPKEDRADEFKVKIGRETKTKSCQFLTADIEQYKKLNAQYDQLKRPKPSASRLQDLQDLVLLDLRLLRGCDVEWNRRTTAEAGSGSPAKTRSRRFNLSLSQDGDGGEADNAGPAASDVAENAATPPSPVAPAQGAAGQSLSIDFTKINVADGIYDELPWDDMKIAVDDLRAFRAYHAVAILLFYNHDLSAKHSRVYMELQAAWRQHFGSPMSHESLGEVPRYGKVSYSDDETTWCLETRRMLVSRLDKDAADTLGIAPAGGGRAKRPRGGESADGGSGGAAVDKSKSITPQGSKSKSRTRKGSKYVLYVFRVLCVLYVLCVLCVLCVFRV